MSVFLHIFMQKFFRYCEKVRMGIECTNMETPLCGDPQLE